MKFEKRRDDAGKIQSRNRKIAIAVAMIVLAGAGIALQFQGPRNAFAELRGVSEGQLRFGGTPQTVAALSNSQTPARYSVSNSSAYCPVSGSGAGTGSGISICDRIWGSNALLGALGDTAIFSWLRAVAASGASRIGPVLQFVAGNCFTFLKQTLPL